MAKSTRKRQQRKKRTPASGRSGPSYPRGREAVALSNAMLIKELIDINDDRYIVNEHTVREFIEISQRDECPWEQFRAHEALRIAFRIVCEAKARRCGREALYLEDFDESDGMLVAWHLQVNRGELAVPTKPHGPDPRAKEARNAWICDQLRRFATCGISPTANDASEHGRSGCDRLANELGMSPDAVKKVWQSRQEYQANVAESRRFPW